MAMIDRPYCAECLNKITGGTAVYDDNAQLYFCDGDCFYGWTDRHIEKIEAFYASMNATQVTLD